MLSDKQKGVVCGAAPALLTTITGFIVAVKLYPYIFSIPDQSNGLFGAMLKWCLLPVICLAVNVGLVGNYRFYSPDDIDGAGLTAGTIKIRIYRATLQNTLEQTVLAVLTYLIWTISMPQQWQGLIIVSAIFFLLGRLFFWRGYESGAAGRAFGFGLTFYPTVLMLLMLCVHFIFEI